MGYIVEFAKESTVAVKKLNAIRWTLGYMSSLAILANSIQGYSGTCRYNKCINLSINLIEPDE